MLRTLHTISARKMSVLYLILWGLTLVCAREFPTPVMDTPIEKPGIIKFEDTYYLVDTFTDSNFNYTFTIHVSKDLLNWEPNLAELLENDILDWEVPWFEPQIHVINGKIRMYCRKNFYGPDYIAVYYADNILGPYTKSVNPVHKQQTSTPTVMHADDQYYIVGTYVGPDDQSVYAQLLSPDGLTVQEDFPHRILNESVPWEQFAPLSPSIIKRNDYYYIFYSALMDCDQVNGIGVARSKSALGPYEKLHDPILISDDILVVPKYPNVVLDVDNENYVLFYSGVLADVNCRGSPVYDYLGAKSLSWDKNDWPYIEKL